METDYEKKIIKLILKTKPKPKNQKTPKQNPTKKDPKKTTKRPFYTKIPQNKIDKATAYFPILTELAICFQYLKKAILAIFLTIGDEKKFGRPKNARLSSCAFLGHRIFLHPLCSRISVLQIFYLHFIR